MAKAESSTRFGRKGCRERNQSLSGRTSIYLDRLCRGFLFTLRKMITETAKNKSEQILGSGMVAIATFSNWPLTVGEARSAPVAKL